VKINEVVMPSVELLCESVLKARDSRDSAKSVLDKAEKEVAAAEKALIEAMVDIGQDSASFGEKNFATKHKIAWKAESSHKDAIIKLLRVEAPEVVKESVHAATLNKFMNERSSEWTNDGPSWWADLCGWVARQESTTLSVTKRR